ncbi:hypothetical protein REPUB_Repub08aG0083600 [Reevesia pubescens]
MKKVLKLETLDCNFKKLEEQSVSFLEKLFSKDEVWSVIQSCDGNKAPRSDNFNMRFF